MAMFFTPSAPYPVSLELIEPLIIGVVHTQGGCGKIFVRKRAKKGYIVLTALKVGSGSW